MDFLTLRNRVGFIITQGCTPTVLTILDPTDPEALIPTEQMRAFRYGKHPEKQVCFLVGQFRLLSMDGKEAEKWITIPARAT